VAPFFVEDDGAAGRVDACLLAKGEHHLFTNVEPARLLGIVLLGGGSEQRIGVLEIDEPGRIVVFDDQPGSKGLQEEVDLHRTVGSVGVTNVLIQLAADDAEPTTLDKPSQRPTGDLLCLPRTNSSSLP
jgi:hypothetical protein